MTKPLIWSKSSAGTELIARASCKSENWDNVYDDIEFTITHNRPDRKWSLLVKTARSTAEPLVRFSRDFAAIGGCVTAANEWVKYRTSAAEKASQRRATATERIAQYKEEVSQQIDTFLAANPTIAEETPWSN